MNKKKIIDFATREILRNKLDSEVVAEQNYKSARKNSEDFLRLDNQLRQLKMQYGQLSLRDKKSATLRKEIEQVKKERLSALEKIGLKEQDILPHYQCEKCGDTGFTNNKRCICLKRNIQQKLLKYSGLDSFEGHNFSQCDSQILKNNPMLEKAYKLAQAYVEKFPNVKTSNLIFMGEVGVGKSFLLECIANALLEKQFFVVYTTAFNLSHSMLKALTLPPAQSGTLLAPLLECDLLIIDDLGSEPMFRNLSTSNMFTIFNEREIKNLSTLISTNMSLEDIGERYGNRIFSRIFNKRKSKVITFQGVDLRIKKN